MTRIKQKYGTSSKKKQYYQIILDRIISSVYKSKDIITIQSLISEFQVSKTPIRDALLQLCDEGLLRSIPKFGYEVAPLYDDFIVQIFDFRILLEINAMDQYFYLIDETAIIKLEELVKLADITYSDNTPLERWKDASNFHLELISCFKNNYIYTQLEIALKYLGISYARSFYKNNTTYFDNQYNQYNQYHKKILDFIKKNDKKNALIYLKEDLKSYNESVELSI